MLFIDSLLKLSKSGTLLRRGLLCFLLSLLLSSLGGSLDYRLFPVRAAKSQTIDQVYGLNINVYNNTWNSSAWTDELVDSGSTWVRAELRYFNKSASTDRNHQQSYNDTFSMLKLAKEAGLKVLGVLDEKTSEFNKTNNDFSPITNLTQWKNIADGALAGYSDLLDAVEMWNEPDLVNLTKASEQNWYMNASPQNYVNMLQVLYTEAKNYNPNMQVLAGALGTVRTTNSTPGYGYGGYFLKNISALNADSYCDCYSIHVYDGYLYPYTNASEGLFDARDAYHQTKSIVADKPVWITELGANHAMSEQNQTDFMERSLDILRSGTDCPNIIWYCYLNPRPEEGSFSWDGIEPPHGIVRQDANLTERAAYSMFQFFAARASFQDGFESGTFSAWTGTRITSGETTSISKTIMYQEAYSAKFTSNGGGGYESAYCYVSLSSSELYARTYVYISQTTASQNGSRLFFIVFRDAQNNGLAYAGWKRTGNTLKWCITIRQGISYVDTFSSGSPLTGRWYCVELHWKKDATNGLAEMWVDGTLVCSSNGKNTAAFGGTSQVQIGLPELYGCRSTIAYCDSVKIATAYISPEPTINSFTVSPNPFSPNGDGINDTTTIKATFNVVINWTLQATNSSHSLIRSWVGNGSSLSVTWDGKNSLGAKVPDGSYNLTLTGSDQSGNSLTSKTIQVAVDAKPSTVTSVSVSPSSFSPKTGQTTKVSYTMSESCYVTIKVYNSAGTLVRTLVNNTLQTSGAKSVTWNGKNSSGTTVPAGTYTIRISIADKAGNKATPNPINKTVKVT